MGSNARGREGELPAATSLHRRQGRSGFVSAGGEELWLRETAAKNTPRGREVTRDSPSPCACPGQRWQCHTCPPRQGGRSGHPRGRTGLAQPPRQPCPVLCPCPGLCRHSLACAGNQGTASALQGLHTSTGTEQGTVISPSPEKGSASPASVRVTNTREVLDMRHPCTSDPSGMPSLTGEPRCIFLGQGCSTVHSEAPEEHRQVKLTCPPSSELPGMEEAPPASSPAPPWDLTQQQICWSHFPSQVSAQKRHFQSFLLL